MLTLKQLRYALALEQTLHFKKASEACSVSQSALSTALSEMEKHLGFQVFERDNKKVLVTPLGERVLETARSIVLQMNDLSNLASASQGTLSHPITIGVIPTIGPFLLPQVLPSVTMKYPECKLNIVEGQSHELVRKVKSGEIDTAILALPYDCDGLLAFEFWQENILLVSHRDEAHSKHSKIEKSHLSAIKLMLLKDGHCLKDHALAACNIAQNLPTGQARLSFDATSLHTIIPLVAARLGSTLAPEMSLASLLAGYPNLQAIPLADRGPHRKIAFLVRPSYPNLNSIELLKEIFTRQLKDKAQKNRA